MYKVDILNRYKINIQQVLKVMIHIRYQAKP